MNIQKNHSVVYAAVSAPLFVATGVLHYMQLEQKKIDMLVIPVIRGIRKSLREETSDNKSSKFIMQLFKDSIRAAHRKACKLPKYRLIKTIKWGMLILATVFAALSVYAYFKVDTQVEPRK